MALSLGLVFMEETLPDRGAARLCNLSGLRHFFLEPCHRADAEARRLGDSVDSDSLGRLGSCLPQLVRIGARPAEALSNLAMLRDEVALTH
jgi:hypothetical protein